jgi:hypothetical protein
MKMKTFSRSLLVSLALSIAISRLNAAPAAPDISFDATHVVATGFHSGRDIVVFGVGMGPGPYFLRMLRYTDTIVADSSGTVRFEIAGGVPDRSVWFAVDSQTREYAVSSPRPALLRPSLSGPGIRHGAQGDGDSIDLDRRLMDILIVRAGSGVWSGSCGRNSLKDLNRGKSGAMRLSAGELTAAPKSVGRISTVLPSDLIVIIDSETLEYFVGSPRQL